MIKSSEGHTYIDPFFQTNYAAAKENGVEVGAYHYSCATNVAEATTEANFFISQLKGKQFDYPICVDLEKYTTEAIGKETLTDIAITYLDILKQAGYYPMIYSYQYYFISELNDTRLAPYDHWLAVRPSITYTGAVGIWQYANDGTVKGITKPVDMDTSFYDYASIIKSLHLNGF